jgi:hypothetical protein
MSSTPSARGLHALLTAASIAALSACHGPKPAARDAAARDASALATDVAAVTVDAPRVVVFDDVPLPDAAAQTAQQAVAGSPTGTTLDLPTSEAWPAVNRWNDAMEREYSEFVRAIGRGVESRRCGRLDRCLRDPQINTLYDPATEGRLSLDVDCGDLPYVLRAYFAFKRRLPYGYVDAITGSGTDPRYMLRVRPVLFHRWNDYRSPRSILRHISDAVHSGMYRVEPNQEQGDYYPITVSRESIRPGTTYYDPNGHVLVVTEVRDDGSVFLIDGHPDGSMTWKRFGEAFELGPRFLWGGFKNWRRQTWNGTEITRALNAELPDFDANQQWTRDLWVAGIPREQWLRPPEDGPRNAIAPGMFHLWVRRTLAAPNVVRDPVRDFREQVRSLCRDVLDRADAVNVAMGIRTHQRSHPGALPYNIYGTNGDWELYSTPSRDARLKASVREINEGILALPADSPVRAQLVAAWSEERTQAACQYSYTNSTGASVALSIDAVLDRLFAISFDPYHCPELRWGAAPGSPELASCPDNAEKLGWYRAEQRLRNQIDRHYGVATPISMGPAEAPAVDFRRTLGVTAAPAPAPAPAAAH